MNTKVYVSLGNSCSIAYNLKLCNLRGEAYPFDWVRVTNLNNITSLIENKFEDFLDIDTFIFKEFSDKFKVNNKFGSYIYKNNYCCFYHEFENKINKEKILSFNDKYKRRINRFLDLLNSDKKIIFIREEFGKVSKNKINTFIKKLYDFNPNINFKIILITNDNQPINIHNVKKYISNIKITNWKRPELNWSELFNI